jgi:phage regulator Rha-like protein
MKQLVVSNAMTSVEISELSGKPHNDLMKAIRKMEVAWGKVSGGKFSLANYTDEQGKPRPMYVLTKSECLYIASKFNDEVRAKLVMRWEKLETERIEEEKNPGLSIDKGIKNYEKQGKSLPWIEKRVQGKLVRNEFTSTLAKHGVEREGFRNCTNNIYDPLWGGGSNVVREKKGLTKDQSIRDNLSLIELTAVSLAELLAAEKIAENNIRGNAGCELASKHASSSVKMALLQNKKAIQ